MTRRRGFLLIDMLVALSIVAVLMVSMLVILGRAGRVDNQSSGARAAQRVAESALLDLQAGRGLSDEVRPYVSVHPEPGSTTPAGHAWVRVSASVAGQSADLVGLVPDAVVPHSSTGAPATREAP